MQVRLSYLRFIGFLFFVTTRFRAFHFWFTRFAFVGVRADRRSLPFSSLTDCSSALFGAFAPHPSPLLGAAF